MRDLAKGVVWNYTDVRIFSNAQGSLILDVYRYARIEPQVLQVEIHPYLTQEPLVKYCKLLNMAVTAYSSFGPQSYVELGGSKNAVSLLQHDVVSSIASKNQKSSFTYYSPSRNTRLNHPVFPYSYCSGPPPMGSSARACSHPEVEQP